LEGVERFEQAGFAMRYELFCRYAAASLPEVACIK
jgi:hypothetical protein